MRVIGGKAKGLRLKGVVSPGTRATTERARAAIFNILHEEQYQGSRVLDLYAGCGSLGIEALSRGAEWADFVERDRRQCQVIGSNLQATGFAANSKVHCWDARRFLGSLAGDYRLVLMDPPYAARDLDAVMERLGEIEGPVAEEGTVVVGHSRFAELHSSYGVLRRASRRRYGDNVVEFYERAGDEW